MDEKKQKEQFSLALLHSMATAAGLVLSDPRVDEDSVDVTLMQRGGGGPLHSPRLDVQLKCSGQPKDTSAATFPFLISVKNYNELRVTNLLVPKVLVVVLVPADVADWLTVLPEHIEARKAAYWMSLHGLPATPNHDNVTVDVPTPNHLNPAVLLDLMARIAHGGAL